MGGLFNNLLLIKRAYNIELQFSADGNGRSFKKITIFEYSYEISLYLLSSKSGTHANDFVSILDEVIGRTNAFVC